MNKLSELSVSEVPVQVESMFMTAAAAAAATSDNSELSSQAPRQISASVLSIPLESGMKSRIER